MEVDFAINDLVEVKAAGVRLGHRELSAPDFVMSCGEAVNVAVCQVHIAQGESRERS